MPLTSFTSRPGGVFRVVERKMADAHWTEVAFLEFVLGSRTVVLSPAEARDALYAIDRDACLSAAIWSRAVTKAREEPADERFKLLVVWLALPRLYRTVRQVTDKFRPAVAPEDVEAEAVLGVLLALKMLNGDEPDVGDLLVRSARSHGWAVGRAEHRERATRRAYSAEPQGVPPTHLADGEPEAAWELEVTPPARPDGLSAPVRFTVSKARLEGERLGSLTDRLGLRDVVFRARRPGEGRRIGSISLRSTEARR